MSFYHEICLHSGLCILSGLAGILCSVLCFCKDGDIGDLRICNYCVPAKSKSKESSAWRSVEKRRITSFWTERKPDGFVSNRTNPVSFLIKLFQLLRLFNQLFHYTFRRRRTADITQTHKQYLSFSFGLQHITYINHYSLHRVYVIIHYQRLEAVFHNHLFLHLYQ